MSHPCTERNQHCENATLVNDCNHLIENVRAVSAWAAHALDREVANEWVSCGGSCGEEMKVKKCVVWMSSSVNPKLYEDVGYAGEAFGREVLEWEHRERREV